MFFEGFKVSNWAGRLNHSLYIYLRREFDDNVIREVLLAAANVKVSRTSLTEAKLAVLRAASERYGFKVVTSEEQWIPRVDFGKGGWANSVARLATPGEVGGVRHAYIASDESLAEVGRLLDAAGEDDLFGALLGIPECCRAAFERFQPTAESKQIDFVPHVLDSTWGEVPYDWRLNYTAQYFGRSLLSFFPCSFLCPVAGELAAETLRMIASCDAAWADRFVRLQRSNVLYTERRGIHLISAPIKDGLITYAPHNIRSTEHSEVASLLLQGDRLEVKSKHAVQVRRGSSPIGKVAGEDVCVCAFY
jgi:hypothetical protein